MSEIEIKEKILEIFKEERQKPDADFNESHFLDFLTFPPHRKDNIKNSFRGVKKYYRFMYRLELEFEICFSLSDLDRGYSVDKITEKVIERIGKRRGNIMIIKQRIEQKETYYIELFLIFLLAIIYLKWGINLISILLTLTFGFGIYWILNSKLHRRKHDKRLKLKILKEET
ncbi:hypothetical protein [Flavobacterium sp. 2]|uniref:hypothetical protein n=1 Tax=Flavobacterium sp. 2 TaxID=308053 RepID=UPI003CE6BDD4